MHRSIRLVVLLVSACGGSKTSSPSPEPAEAAPRTSAAPHDAATACADHVAHLAAQLHDLAAAQPGFLPFVPGITAPVTSTAQPVDTRGIVIAVTRDGGMFTQGQKLTAGDLRGYLEQVHRTALDETIMNGGTAADATVPLYIWADAATPINAVAAVAAAVEPEPAKPRATKSKRTPEEEQARKQAIEQARAAGILGNSSANPPAPFALRLIVTSSESAAPSLPESEPEATRHLADQLKAAIGTCGPISATLATVSLEGVPAKEAEKLVTDLPKGLESCSCKVADIGALTAGLRTWFGAWAPPLRWIEALKLDATDKRPIRQLVAK